MKSIVLCESTLVNKNEESRENLKEGKTTEDNEKAKEKKMVNGSEEKKSEFVSSSTKENENCLQNGESAVPEVSTDEDVGEKSCDSTRDTDSGENETSATSGKNALVEDVEGVSDSTAVAKENSENVQKLSDIEVNNSESQNSSEIVKIIDEPSCVNIEDSKSESCIVVPDEKKEETSNEEVSEVAIEESNDLINSNSSVMVQIEDGSEEVTESDGSKVTSTDEGKETEKETDKMVEDVILDEDEDENKENENVVCLENGQDEPSKEELMDIEDCQIISDSEKGVELSQEKETKERADSFTCDEETDKDKEGDEGKEQEPEQDEAEKIEKGGKTEKGEITVDSKSEPEQSNIENDEVKECSETDLEMSVGKSEIKMDAEEMKESQPEVEETGCRKRSLSTGGEEDSFSKKRKLSVEESEGKMKKEKMKEEEKQKKEENDLESSPSVEPMAAVPKDEIVCKVEATKRPSSVEGSSKKLKTSPEEDEERKTEPTGASLFLANFRGALKSLTRSDLEELIVQKLCEVVTERSNVGELRRKAQALEQDQERWRAKVQSLTKQMREMEMVMKKYMSEVQKQIKEGDTHVVTPLKVTRSVGLQVSFYSSGNKGQKPNSTQAAASSPAQNVNGRVPKATPPKQPPPPPQFSVPPPNVRNKPGPASQKNSSPPKSPATNQQKRSAATRSDQASPPQSRPVVPQSLLNNTRVPQSQAQGARPNYKSGAGVSQNQQQSPQQQQNGSKVIDLTDDDDRHTGSVAKPSGSIRVVNHLSQPPVPQNNRFAYLLPTTSTSATGTSGGQSRQVLIATPTMPQQSNRQLMCPMPPLLLKGGNIVPSPPQPQVVNPNNRVILPKTLRHPAPLPQPPLNQNNRPNLKLLPPRPALKISKVQTGIVLSWNMTLGPEHAPIASYQLYAYQEGNSPPATSLWKKVGDVKALPLPMACTLTQFMSGHKYHFAVRAVDHHSRIGPFSFPGTIVLVK